MMKLASEFCAVSQLYTQLGQELADTDPVDVNNPRGYLQFILHKRDCLARIEKTNSRALQLCGDWKTCRSSLDAKSRSEIDALAEFLCKQAARVYELCESHMREVQAAKDGLRRDLAEMGKGARYLKSVKPAKNNYPKFIDSHC